MNPAGSGNGKENSWCATNSGVQTALESSGMAFQEFSLTFAPFSLCGRKRGKKDSLGVWLGGARTNILHAKQQREMPRTLAVWRRRWENGNGVPEFPTFCAGEISVLINTFSCSRSWWNERKRKDTISLGASPPFSQGFPPHLFVKKSFC